MDSNYVNKFTKILMLLCFVQYTLSTVTQIKEDLIEPESKLIIPAKEQQKVKSDSFENENNEKLEKEEPVPGEVFVVYFFIVSLAISSICRELKKITGLPYTPLLLIAGMALGAYIQNLGMLGTSLDLLLEINPHGILLIFIPTIIFESAFNIEPFVFKKEIIQILILAIPGVMIGMTLTGIGFHTLLGYGSEFSWSAVFIFSSIVSATDPVAVVALLKELGTPTKFNILLEGESLMNDGTAMVFYLVFIDIYQGESSGIISIIGDFLWLTVGGVVSGAIMCFLVIFWIKKIVRDDVLTTNLTFLSCYLVFFISEVFLEVSGIIAIVTLGVLMAKFGKVSINPESQHSLHSVWSYLQYVLESVLFIITGVFIGKSFFGGLTSIDQQDIIKMLIFFVLMNVIRYLMLKILQKPLNATGWPVDQKDIFILTYGGLRGAIALCLALMVAVDENFSSRYREIVIFFVTSMITLTVFINGLTIKYVINKIKFKEINDSVKKIKEGIEKQLIIETYRRKNKLLNNKFLALAEWDKVVKLAGVFDDVKIRKLKKEKQEKNQLHELEDLSIPIIQKNEAVIETRARFYQLLKAEIWKSFEEGFCSSGGIRVLLELIDLVQEESDRPIWIWECVSQEFLNIKDTVKMLAWKDVPVIGYFLRKILISRLLHNYDILQTLVTGLKNIEKTKRVLPINIDYIKLVFAELSVNLKNCEDHLYNFIELFPDLAKAIQEKNAAMALINTQKSLLDEFLHQGSIQEEEHQFLRQKFEKRIKNLEVTVSDWKLPNIDTLQIICPLFMNLNQKNFDKIIRDRKELTFQKREILFKKGKISNGVLIIKKGVVIEKDGFFNNSHGMGRILSFGNLLNSSGQCLFTLEAETDVQAYFIPNQTLIQIMFDDPHFEEEVYKLATYSLFETIDGINQGIDADKIPAVLDKSDFKKYEENVLIEIKNGGYLFEGKLKEVTNNNEEVIYVGNCFIPPSQHDFQSLEKCKMLRFQQSLQTALESERMSISHKASFSRDSFNNLINIEKDIDKIYNVLEKKMTT